MDLKFDAIPCPDKDGQNIESDLQVASMVRLARSRSLRTYDLLKELRKQWPYVLRRYDLDLGEASNTEQAWLLNIGWLLMRQHVAELRLMYELPLMPYALAQGVTLDESDAVAVHIAAFMTSIVGHVPEHRQDADPYYRAAMTFADDLCTRLADTHMLEPTPNPGFGTRLANTMSDGTDITNRMRWMSNMLALTAQYTVSRQQGVNRHRRPTERRVR